MSTFIVIMKTPAGKTSKGTIVTLSRIVKLNNDNCE